MDAIQQLLLAIAIIAAWTVAVALLAWKGVLARFNMSLAGPIIMWKTARGRKLIDRLARPTRFWRLFGDFSIVLCLVAMIGLTALLVWIATIVPSIPKESAPRPELLLGIPVLNPVIPLSYGILGLAVAIVFHEFHHGILARTAKVRLQSLGVLLFIVPIGAFVEPDEEELKKIPRRQRARLFAVGPAINILVALVFAVLFSSAMMGSVRPAHSGVGITEFAMNDSPAQKAGLIPGMIIFQVNGIDVASLSEFIAVMDQTSPGQTVNAKAYYRGSVSDHNVELIESSDGRAIMGVRLLTITTAYFHPIEGAKQFGSLERSILTYIQLPFLRLQPTQEPVTDFYVIEGIWGSVPPSLFWTLANSFYWLFWLNVMVGLTNALPAIPLDGGYLFRDGIDALLQRMRKDLTAEAREKAIRGTSYAVALFILALILWQVVGPQLL